MKYEVKGFEVIATAETIQDGQAQGIIFGVLEVASSIESYIEGDRFRIVNKTEEAKNNAIEMIKKGVLELATQKDQEDAVDSEVIESLSVITNEDEENEQPIETLN